MFGLMGFDADAVRGFARRHLAAVAAVTGALLTAAAVLVFRRVRSRAALPPVSGEEA